MNRDATSPSGFEGVLLPLGDALEAVLAAVERTIEPVAPAADPSPRVRTGIAALDRVLGGVPRGRITVVGTDRPLVAEILVAGAARGCPHPSVIAAPDPVRIARAVLAAETGIPAAVIESGVLGRSDWREIEGAVVRLGERRVTLTASIGPTVVRSAVSSVGALVLLVTGLHRFGNTDTEAIHELEHLTVGMDIATVAITNEPMESADVAVVSADPRSSEIVFMATDATDLIRQEVSAVDPLMRRLEQP